MRNSRKECVMTDIPRRSMIGGLGLLGATALAGRALSPIAAHAARPVRPRARALGLPMQGHTGTDNAITDVAGVRVGHTTLISGQGEHAVRTGVTAILPRAPGALLHPCWAGTFSMNGNGEMTGTHWIEEADWFMGPIAITNTCSIGTAHQAVAKWMVRSFPDHMGEDIWPLPVVAETYDGWLNDIGGFHITERHVLDAIRNARPGPVAEGNVGGGTGMITYEFKGGIGTSSRRVDTSAGQYTVGVLVQANNGIRPWLKVCGAPVGLVMRDDTVWTKEKGSIIIIVATDAPLMPTQLRRMAKRAGIGMGRLGTPSGNDSGDLYLAFTTANDPGAYPVRERVHIDALNDDDMDAMFMGVVQAVEESAINALLGARTMTGRRNRTVHAIDPDRLRDLVLRANAPFAHADLG
ncbi:aminopeptidase [Komagataeibacter xylinus]|nr:aminopeptidase [Komagataeibacter xylinus]RFP06995.1 aminopeptidase [Komagataeibacter xylinus]